MPDSISTAEQLHNFVDDLGRTLGYDPNIRSDCKNIILCGMGGSAITADVVLDCCMDCSKVPVSVIKSPGLPIWVGDRTLAIVSSYSGNTAETIEMYNEAKGRGCRIVVITSGGILERLASADGNQIIVLPKGLHPRHSIGYMIGYTLSVMESSGCPSVSDEIRSMLPSLREYRDLLESGGSPVRDLASRYMCHVPVICADNSIRSVVLRWKTQFNENSKYVAFCDNLPGMKYSGLRSWSKSENDVFALTFLVGEGLFCDSVREAMSVLEGSGRDFTVIDVGGSSRMEAMFRAIMLGDYISVTMADMRGVDAAEVKPVMLMKERLSDRPVDY
ncbi:MAG: SIS domain-containing protein [Candidatus Methanomethylophilaceae archaeon]|nr:SIS domain-containing protein [Candidatus Methanomethylophilaceae archaeon]